MKQKLLLAPPEGGGRVLRPTVPVPSLHSRHSTMAFNSAAFRGFSIRGGGGGDGNCGSSRNDGVDGYDSGTCGKSDGSSCGAGRSDAGVSCVGGSGGGHSACGIRRRTSWQVVAAVASKRRTSITSIRPGAGTYEGNVGRCGTSSGSSSGTSSSDNDDDSNGDGEDDEHMRDRLQELVDGQKYKMMALDDLRAMLRERGIDIIGRWVDECVLG
jgi:hypothetical protein